MLLYKPQLLKGDFMYLFNRKNGAVEVYALTPDVDALKAYREQELKEKIDYNETLYYAVTNSKKVLEQKDNVNVKELNYNCFNKFHIFKEDTNRSMFETCAHINKYLKGEYENSRLVKVVDENNDTVKYLVVPFIYVGFYPILNIKHMDGIISVPESLFILEQFEQRNFEYALSNTNIDKILTMYDLSLQPTDILKEDEVSKEAIESSKLVLERKKNL